MQFFAKKSKGFTLIELLVVIAIIGILSAIVLVNVNAARNKARDVAIQANLGNMRVAGEMYYEDTSNSYLGFCTSTAANGGARSMTELAKHTVAGTAGTDCNDAAGGWAACGQMNVVDQYWCVDSAGNSKAIATRTTCVATWAATACP